MKFEQLQVSAEGMTYWQELACNEELWHKAVFEQFPSVIAHEYKRLREELAKDRPFAAMLQLKDVMEALLKVEVLLACAWAAETQGEEFLREVGCQITKTSLSFGDWRSMGCEILTYFESIGQATPQIIFQPLDELVRIYEDAKIVSWRNETVAHGALMFEEDDNFKKEIKEKLTLLTEIFRSVENDICCQRLYVCGSDLLLMGVDKARGLGINSGDVEFRSEKGLRFIASPYIVIKENGVYFFDNQKRKNKTQRLCYPTGKKVDEKEGFFSRLHGMARERQQKVELEDEVTDVLSESQDRYLNQLNLEDDFVEPPHLVEWLRVQTTGHAKGVYLLKMPRGTGKSTFCEKINRLNNNPLIIDRMMDVRCYHISRTQLRSEMDFERGIEDLWSQAYNEERRSFWNISQYRSMKGLTPAQAFAAYLKQIQLDRRRRTRTGKILMVIDGLDEAEENVIWEYLPAADMLADGIHILLTSRDPEQEDLPHVFSNRLEGLDLQSSFTVRRESDDNKAFLKSYVAQFKTIKEEQIEKLMELAEYRVLYLSMHVDLLRSGLKMEELPESEKLCGRFIAEIAKQYGEKKALRMYRILGVLSGVGRYEPLSLKEIAELSDENGVTLELLGIMNDLRSIMKVNRGYAVDERRYVGENRYELVNEDVAKSIFGLLPEAQQQAKDSVIDVLKDIEDMPEDEKITDGMLVTLAYATELLELSGVKREEYPQISEELGMKIADRLGEKYEIQIMVFHRLKRGFLQALKLCRAEAESFARSRIYLDYGILCRETGDIVEAYHVIERAVEIRKKLSKEGFLPKKRDLAVVLYNFGLTLSYELNTQTVNVRAFKMVEEAAKIIESMDEADQSDERMWLASLYCTMGNMLINHKQPDNMVSYTVIENKELDRAEELLNKALKIVSDLEQIGRSPDLNVLFGVYNSKGGIFYVRGENDKALEMYEKSLAFLRELEKSGELVDWLEVARLHGNIALVWFAKEKWEKAFASWREAKDILKKMDDEGRLLNRAVLANVYNNIAYVLTIQKQEGALKWYEESLKLMIEMDKRHQLPDRISLAGVYYNIAKLWFDRSKSKALKNLQEAKKILDEVDKKDQRPDYSDLVISVYRWIVEIVCYQNQWSQAYIYCKEECSVMERLYNKGRLKNRSDLAIAYNKMSEILLTLNRRPEALMYLNKARAISL